MNFTCLVVGVGVACAWLRVRSGSVWPSTVWHGTHNAVRELFLTPLTVAASAGSRTWLGETGYALAAMGVCVGMLFAMAHLRVVGGRA